ncbi:11163_t:CDS:2 [Gigaspora margarita]|uniref:11163_t:CDS:1 n=1 Tax=Gigaspora margarita TaxID=4874 RepID=A0ABM8W494_GIGMA|nr:11163_t:CDS:2 [Gigaspora margarita]
MQCIDYKQINMIGVALSQIENLFDLVKDITLIALHIQCFQIDPVTYITSLQILTFKITASNDDILNYLKDHAKDLIILQSDDNPAVYLADSCEKDRILFNINEELEKEQFGQTESLLNKNTYVFTQKISKDDQTVGLVQTNLVCYEINMGMLD